MKQNRSHIFSQMFDVRPTTQEGVLDLEKMKSVRRVVKICPKKNETGKKSGRVEALKIQDIKASDHITKQTCRFQKVLQQERLHKKLKEVSWVSISADDSDNIGEIKVEFKGGSGIAVPQKPDFSLGKIYPKEYTDELSFSNIFSFKKNSENIISIKSLGSFVLAGACLFLLIMGANVVSKGYKIKGFALMKSQEALASLTEAKDGITSRDFQKSSLAFSEAYARFSEISESIDEMGAVIVHATKYLPLISKISSGSHLVEAGKDASRAGTLISETVGSLDEVKNQTGDNSSISYLEVFRDCEKNIKEIAALLKHCQLELEEVNTADIPEDKRAKFAELKTNLPAINGWLADFLDQEKMLADILGGNGPRKYLFLFQNNQEMRATGGFIGTYALLDIFNGHVRNFYIDGIFNPDGQLKERVVPPVPIQKISASWSLHDSNWFPDFPVSAEKAAWFYEKTGGPTVDGVITMTPTVMQKMLEITGPIEMPEYGVTVDKDNFIEKIQYEVEVDYDKELNQPKKILADLAPKLFERILNANDFSELVRTMEVLAESLNERHIMIYSKNYEIEKNLSRWGWSGEILETQKDYLSVINTNINGFKTDGVIDESISHEAQIQPDGTVIDTLTVKRRHNGGNAAHEWWNKVNADYMRVYVPKGSVLVSAEGQTREFNTPPLDYAALGFKYDPQLKMEEDSIEIDERSGTQVYEDDEKTVFANWAYVSPQETVTLVYKYILPFKVDTGLKHKSSETYSILFQKQSGSIGSTLSSQVLYPAPANAIWHYPEENTSPIDNAPENFRGISMEGNLQKDKFLGVAFSR